MKIHEIILEKEVTPYKYTSYSERHAISLLLRYCFTALHIFDKPIWRGIRNHNRELVFKASPSTGVRVSQNTSNYFTSLLDSSPYMRGWPKRGASFICSADQNYVGDFGTEFAIFPVNSAKIAICPEYDMWLTEIVIPEFDISFKY